MEEVSIIGVDLAKNVFQLRTDRSCTASSCRGRNLRGWLPVAFGSVGIRTIRRM